MKFSTSLKFNSIREWWDSYIAYDYLKKQIYAYEREAVSLDSTTGFDANFTGLLLKERVKIQEHYNSVLGSLKESVNEIDTEIENYENGGVGYSSSRYRDDEEDVNSEDDEDDISFGERSGLLTRLRDSISSLPSRRRRSRSVSLSQSGFLPSATMPWTRPSSTKVLVKRRLITAFTTLSNLESFRQLNQKGFEKILKKYDKVLGRNLKDEFLAHNPPIDDAEEKALGEKLQALYARVVCHNDLAKAQAELGEYKHEHIIWERESVWRMLLRNPRRLTSTGTPPSEPEILPRGVKSSKPHIPKSIPLPFTRLRIPFQLVWIALAVAVLVYCALAHPLQGQDLGTENRTLGVLLFCTVLWATEAIPLFVTSISVPLLLVVLRCLKEPDASSQTVSVRLADSPTLKASPASHLIFSTLFSPTIMLLIGGFTISSALSKSGVDRVGMGAILRMGGTSPRMVLLAVMGVSWFSSMWISNVAAPTLTLALIRPILRTLPSTRGLDLRRRVACSFILATALAASLGGLASPISSPQNLVTLGYIEPSSALSWAGWFAVSLPIGILSLLGIWGFLVVGYDVPSSDEFSIRPISKPTIATGRGLFWGFDRTQWFVILVSLATITLWVLAKSEFVESLFGDMGVVAILPVVIFFGSGVLGKEDFDQFAWTIVFLAMGGIGLGKGVTLSGLLEIFDRSIRDFLFSSHMGIYGVVCVLGGVVLVISTFISHTIASVLLVPIAKEVGQNLPSLAGSTSHANLLVFMTGLICSLGMGMPVSGFPNQTAANQEDDLGQLYLTNVDFLKFGVPASIFATLVTITIGFLLMKAIGL